jgi:hypothetical protein
VADGLFPCEEQARKQGNFSIESKFPCPQSLILWALIIGGRRAARGRKRIVPFLSCLFLQLLHVSLSVAIHRNVLHTLEMILCGYAELLSHSSISSNQNIFRSSSKS